jgi:predicted amidohydrolase
MRQPLGLAVAQPPCVAYDVAANVQAHAAIIRSTTARVVVFPELSITGYELDAPAIGTNDARLNPIVQACAYTGSVALVGAPLKGKVDEAHIAMLAVDGRGASVAYRKVWVDSTEARFAPGAAPGVLDIDGWRLGLAICKDTGIERHWADTAALGIDAYVAGVVLADDETWKIEDRSRQIANDYEVWVAMASFAGPTGGGYTATAGCSGIWSPAGVAVARVGPDAGAVASAVLT